MDSMELSPDHFIWLVPRDPRISNVIDIDQWHDWYVNLSDEEKDLVDEQFRRESELFGSGGP